MAHFSPGGWFAVSRRFPYHRPVHCLVTAGPTYEPLDKVRRLTNFSTGRLGSGLAQFLVERGHEVTLLLGEQATYRDPHAKYAVDIFTTTADLQARLRTRQGSGLGALFHAAAVSDFTFGQVWMRAPTGELTPARSGKISTREGTLLAELLPTQKIISEVRGWFPEALIVGWKFEVDGDRASTVALGEKQIRECRTDACVVNGPAYGNGFGLVRAEGGCANLPDSPALFHALEQIVQDFS